MSELDFNNISLGDVTVGGKPISEEQQQDTVEEGVKETSTDGVPESKSEGVVVEQKVETVDTKAEEPAKDPAREQEPTPATYNFKDDFIKGVVEYYEKTGDVTPYLQAKLVDFNQMSDEEVMRRNLREQYPDVSEKAFDRLYKQQIADKFKLDADEWGEDDSELGKELLKAEATKARQKYIDWQTSFRAPEPQLDESQKQEEEQMQEALRQFELGVRNNDLTKNILDNKRLSIKVGDGEFNYELSQPESLLDMTLDNNKFFEQFASQDGQIDYERWYLTSAFSQDPQGFIKSIGNYFKGMGREEVAKEIKNPSNNSVGDVPTEGTGDFKSGLLKAFADRGMTK